MSPPRCRVSFGEGHSSGWLQWHTLATSQRTDWSAPSVGDPVTVISEGGDPLSGVVLLGLLVDSRTPPSSSPDAHVTAYVDGATQSYDTASHTLTWQGIEGGSVRIVGDAKVEIIGSADVTIRGPAGIKLDGPVTVTKTLHVNGIGTFDTDVVVGGNLSAEGDGEGVGNVRVKGNLTAGGDVSDRTSSMQFIRTTYNGHIHHAPDGDTGIPLQPMAARKTKKSR